jgi:predicted glutamine amidotransferase
MIALRPVDAKGRGSNIPNAVIDTAMKRHSDGFGVAWREFDDAGVPHLFERRFGPKDGKRFRKMLKRVDAAGVEYVTHFRYATHGPCDEAHAHPYIYEDTDPEVGTVMVFHNGVIDIPTKAEESDTEVFVRDVLANLPSRWWTRREFTYLVGESIGWSRLVIMTATETVSLQDDDGTWDAGLWYSSNHKPYSVSTTYKGGSVQSAYSTSAYLTQGVKDAHESWEALKAKAEEGDFDPSRPAGITTGMMHGGHNVTFLEEVNLAVDIVSEAGVVCDTCYTVGDLYVIEGTAFIDMAHRAMAEDMEDANAALALLPAYTGPKHKKEAVDA